MFVVLTPTVLRSIEELSLHTKSGLQRRARTLKFTPLTQAVLPYIQREAASLKVLSGGGFPVLHASDVVRTNSGHFESRLCLRYAACHASFTFRFPVHTQSSGGYWCCEYCDVALGALLLVPQVLHDLHSYRSLILRCKPNQACFLCCALLWMVCSRLSPSMLTE